VLLRTINVLCTGIWQLETFFCKKDANPKLAILVCRVPTLNVDKDYYRVSHGVRWPTKWYAPKSCKYGTYPSASDVWSYGITL